MEQNQIGRGDLVLPQGTYVLLQDVASGQVEVVAGPSKISVGDTDKPVVYDSATRRYKVSKPDDAIKVCPAADEGQYIILVNPSIVEDDKKHPGKGRNQDISDMTLSMGRRINLQGPDTFPLYPGQVADVLDGHQLKSNEYLLIRVYNEKEAKENLKNAVVKSAETGDKNSKLFDEREIVTGNLLIIKGTDVSFYIPPTGIEVLQANKSYVRNAVTLERLEYCILLDQNGDKRYVKGPDVVFPKPTETFVENKNRKIFRAIELNENMGIYLKVIAEYEEDKKKYNSGDELFITGNEQKIYFPRAEHAIVKYGEETIHYATAVPKGEGRYILDKIGGSVELDKGPKMLLPDPRSQVIVKRMLPDKIVELWYPGNQEALDYNRRLSGELENSKDEYIEDYSSRQFSARTKQTMLSSQAAGMMADEMDRKTNYTRPRTIKLDTKYEGAVLLNIWPNFAVQIVNKSGERKVVEGPNVVMLEYDETLEVLELSTGKPKTDHTPMQTVYLQTKNNVVSDIITVETKDLISVDIRLSYKVDFEGDSTKWFNVSDYVKLLSQHMRSLIRNVVKKTSIEEFNENATDIIRDTILGKTDGSVKRTGRVFEENGMKIYDVEVLNLRIGDDDIDDLLRKNQHTIVEQSLRSKQIEKDLEFHKTEQEATRTKLDEIQKTTDKEQSIELEVLIHTNEVKRSKLEAEEEEQDKLNKIYIEKRGRLKSDLKQKLEIDKEASEIRIRETKEELAAIQPGLIEALISTNDINLIEVLAKNVKEQKNGSGLADLFTSGTTGGFEGLLDTVKGTNLENRVKKIVKDYQVMKDGRKKDK